jgi:MFS family permease
MHLEKKARYMLMQKKSRSETNNHENEHYVLILIRNGITLLILDIFFIIAVTLVNLLPAIYDVVEIDYGLSSAVPIILMEACFVILACILSIYWGYLIDKIDRRKVLYRGLSIWILGLLICLVAPNFPIFVIGRMITAIGIGAQMPSVYSIMADIIPARFWSTLFASLALLSAICNGFGNFLSGFVSPMNIWGLGWKFSFALFSIASVVCFALLFFINLPIRGSGDPWVGKQIRTGAVAYTFTIRKEDLKPLWRIPTNRYMLYLSFFAIIPGATMASFLIYYLSTGPMASFPPAIRTPVASIFAGMVGVGYLAGTFFLGPIFDWLNQKKTNARARFTFWGLFIGIPLLVIGFLSISPVDYNSLNLAIDPTDTSFSIDKYVLIGTRIFEEYPNFTLYFFAIFFGTFTVSPITINRTPTLLEVNLPEHMGSSQAILNFSDQMGKGFTFLLVAFQFLIFHWLFSHVDGKIVIILSVLFYLLPLYWWRKISRVIQNDKERKIAILRERTNHLDKDK